jgi:ribosome biogenesis protein YTM1
VNLNQEELSKMVNQLIVEIDNKWKETDFDFLIEQELLRTSLLDHISKKDLSTETLLYIECILRTPPPVPGHTFNHNDWVSAVHTCQDKFLTGCYDNTVHILREDSSEVLSLDGHTGPVKSVKWAESTESSSCMFLTASQDQHIFVWKFNSGCDTAEVCAVCKGHARSVEGVSVSSDRKRFASVSWDKMLKVWSLDEGGEGNEERESAKRRKIKGNSPHKAPPTKTPLLTMSGHTQAVTGVDWTSDGDIVTCGWDHCIRLWDVETAVNKANMMWSKAFNSVSWSPLNQLVASASCDPSVRVWDPRDKGGSVVKMKLSPHKAWVKDVRWSPVRSEQLVSGSYDSYLKLWDTRSPAVPLYSMVAHEGKVLCVDWDSSGGTVASGGADGKMRTHRMD